MPSDFIDRAAPSLQGAPPKLPRDLPHGLLTPPEKVRAQVEQERTQHPPDVFARAEQRLLNEGTLQYYFAYLGHEVIYRPTPLGPEILAVGEEEVLALKKTKPLEEQLKLKTWLPY
jgi:hypothetical protein